MIAEPVVDVDPREQARAFWDHIHHGCVVCRDAPNGRELCADGADLFNTMMGSAGLDPCKAN